MRPVVFRLVLFATLFGLWMAYLGYLVLTRPLTPQGRRALVLSRPQIYSSDLDVVVQLDKEPSDETEVTVTDLLYASAGIDVKKGDKIRVSGLDKCHPVQGGRPTPSPDWEGPGAYLLPLRPLREGPAKAADRFEVAAVPPSPGFHEGYLLRIYPATAEALAQYRLIAPPDGNGQPQKPPR